MRSIFFAALLALVAVPAAAQPLTLEIKDGRVSIDAANVPLRQILAEWARVGGTKVIGGDRVVGSPLTIKLVDVPEDRALELILRNVAGYIAAPRVAAGGPSVYDRIVVMATSASAAAAASNRPNAGTSSLPNTPPNMRMPPRPPGLPRPGEPGGADQMADGRDGDVEPDNSDTGVAPQPPVFTFPQPGQVGNQVFVPMGPQNTARPGMPGSVQTPTITLQPNQNGQPTIYNFVPNGQPTPGAPPNQPFQIIGSPTPGVIQQPPVQPGQPVPAPRPPGR